MNMHTVQTTWSKSKSYTNKFSYSRIYTAHRSNTNDENISIMNQQTHRVGAGKGHGHWCSK